eukprot:TRINITY_DN5370_c0_g1_i1.p1 TRINITY_DN5370_c0_g1~~TRINITY_DN5370_c0_g1_i1.p1  ORF type:complete len:508 (+),score=75.40 TRINITY_DN5370_c0_g1_i1:184-1524(+)
MNQNLLQEFKKEVAIFAHLRHPNVVLFMGACTEPGKLCIVTEYMPKGDVQHVLRNPNNRVTMGTVIAMARDCARGMAWLHESIPPIIHCDLKPSNLLVDAHFRVKICDFGLSCFVKDLSRPGGSPLYMGPEVFVGGPITDKVDVYSFGLVLWEMVTRETPFPQFNTPTASIQMFAQSIVGGDRPPIPDTIIPSLASLIKDCWQKKAKKRPTFTSIIPLLNNIFLDVTIRDPEGAKFWRHYFAGEKEIPWLPFAATFYQYLGEVLPNDRIHSTKFRALEAMLVTQDLEGQQQEVTIERFGHFLSWFGPLTKNVPYTVPFLDRLKNTMLSPGFHGFISKNEAESILSVSGPGSYLIRVSQTEPFSSPYTISMHLSPRIVHQRVARVGDKFVTQGVIPGQQVATIFEAAGGIENLMRTMAQTLRLTKPCEGSKIQMMTNYSPQGEYTMM